MILFFKTRKNNNSKDLRNSMTSRVTSGDYNDIILDIKKNMDEHTVDYVNTEEQKPKVLLINNSWSDASEKILIAYGENVTCNKKNHEKAVGINKTISNVFNIIFIIISVILTVITSIESLIPDTVISQFIRIILSGILTILSLIYNFFSFDENSAKHTEAFKKYSKLYNTIQRQMCLHRTERKDAKSFIPYIQSEYDNIKSESISLGGNECKELNIETNNSLKSLNVSGKETPLMMINTSLKLHGDLKDEDVQKIPLEELEHLNKNYLNKRYDYEHDRYINHIY
jgi:hypothetical protein